MYVRVYELANKRLQLRQSNLYLGITLVTDCLPQGLWHSLGVCNRGVGVCSVDILCSLCTLCSCPRSGWHMTCMYVRRCALYCRFEAHASSRLPSLHVLVTTANYTWQLVLPYVAVWRVRLNCFDVFSQWLTRFDKVQSEVWRGKQQIAHACEFVRNKSSRIIWVTFSKVCLNSQTW